jgi:hypothetical protein
LSSRVTVSRAFRMCSGSGAFMDVLSPGASRDFGLVDRDWAGVRRVGGRLERNAKCMPVATICVCFSCPDIA